LQQRLPAPDVDSSTCAWLIGEYMTAAMPRVLHRANHRIWTRSSGSIPIRPPNRRATFFRRNRSASDSDAIAAHVGGGEHVGFGRRGCRVGHFSSIGRGKKPPGSDFPFDITTITTCGTNALMKAVFAVYRTARNSINALAGYSDSVKPDPEATLACLTGASCYFPR
jgi:hypothetical protein